MKALPLVIFLLVCSTAAFAVGEMKTLDFSNSTSALVQLGLRDGVRFDWADRNHQVVVRNLNEEKSRVELTVFIEGSKTPYYASVSPKTRMELDFERDDVKDMKVSFIKFVNEDNVILLFEKVSEPKIVEKVESPGSMAFLSKWPFKRTSYNIALLVIVVVLIVVLLASNRFVRRKYRRLRRSMALG